MLAARDADHLLTTNKYDKVILIGMGVLLPLISLSGAVGSEIDSRNILLRLTIVDLLSLSYVGSLVISKRLRISKAGAVYLYALILALFIGLFLGILNPGALGIIGVVIEFSALIMAFSYWFVGYTTGHSTELARYLVAGVLLGVLWQAPIVIHDFLFPLQQWFPGDMLGRVTGTFRAGAQLSVYGFTSAGILLGPGRALFQKPGVRLAIVLAAMLGLFFVVAGSRRTYILLSGLWLAAFVTLSVWNFRHTGCLLVIMGIIGVIVMAIVAPPDLQGSFVIGRLVEALSSLQSDDNFIFDQFQAVFGQFWTWFPFGIGVSRGQILTHTGHEIHNGLLALMVETGLLGFLAFMGLASKPVFRDWNTLPQREAQYTRRLVSLFVVVAVMTMMHGVLHRDRGFMLFVGLASALYMNIDSEVPEQELEPSVEHDNIGHQSAQPT